MGFAFDCSAEGRVIKCPTIVEELLWCVRTLRMIPSMVTAQLKMLR